MKVTQWGTVVVGLTLAGSAFAQAKPEDEIRYRQSVMNVVGRAFGPLTQMAQDKAPYNKDVVAKNTQVIDMLIGLHWNSFAPGTEKGAPTKADLKIWSEPGKFKDAAEKSQQASSKLLQTAKTGDEKAVKGAIGDLGKTCKGCHDDYRLKDARS
jgi:cytochrome c556